MNVRIQLNNPSEEFCLGLYCHKATQYWENQETGEYNEEDSKTVTRLVIGFLIFNIDVIW